jgi:hypothetical protein
MPHAVGYLKNEHTVKKYGVKERAKFNKIWIWFSSGVL